MRLKKLLANIPGVRHDQALAGVDIRSICTDSRKARPGSLFVAIKGRQWDGKNFIDRAVGKGVRVVALQENATLARKHDKVVYLYVKDTRLFLRQLTKNFFGPLKGKIKILGVTGTNGKTTITYVLEAMLKQAGGKCGVIGTVNYRYDGKKLSAAHTTPGYLENQKILAAMARKSIDYCVMEVSSHALDQDRVADIPFKTAIFTNLTTDHLDYHKTIYKYFASKKKLFVNPRYQPTSVINQDDPFGRKLARILSSRVITYGIEHHADVTAQDIFLGLDGSSFTLRTPKGKIFVKTHLIGRFNIYNILAGAAAAVHEGLPLEVIRQGLLALKAVPGRLEKVRVPHPVPIFIDYAHTPDALEKVLSSLRKVTPRKILLVFGCGGDRDTTKRPQMGAIASTLADRCIVTSDNPRGERPRKIIDQIVEGFQERAPYKVIIDRKKAIQAAVRNARRDDVILIAGKGHEPYQTFKDKVIPFNERNIIKECVHA
jgi:UDP-N-acetylmuramoyl-L-alanyl-D-glutamate--2,6-diaminopimelate ligase